MADVNYILAKANDNIKFLAFFGYFALYFGAVWMPTHSGIVSHGYFDYCFVVLSTFAAISIVGMSGQAKLK